MLVEGLAVHVLLLKWSALAAWIFTISTAYAALWLIADYRATVLRPILISAETLWIRAGFRCTMKVPLGRIAGVSRTKPEFGKESVNLTMLGTPTHWVTLSEPMLAEGPYGVRRRVRAVGIEPDLAGEFERVLESCPLGHRADNAGKTTPNVSRAPTPGSESELAGLRRTILGVLAGGGVFLGIMLALAGVAVALGWLRQGEAGGVNLRPWLILEIIGGVPASILGGVISRRIAHRDRGPAVLATFVLGVGVLEATEIVRNTNSGSATWLALLAPVFATAGVLFGGWGSSRGSSRKTAQQAAAADRAARGG
jgi:hypothetical protein